MDPDVAAAVQSHLPPDRAAAMIASGGLDTADAAAMLDKLSVDAADRVMAALPPNVAERTAALVASDEIRARAVARLPSSQTLVKMRPGSAHVQILLVKCMLT